MVVDAVAFLTAIFKAEAIPRRGFNIFTQGVSRQAQRHLVGADVLHGDEHAG